jgi:hypothetical protein
MAEVSIEKPVTIDYTKTAEAKAKETHVDPAIETAVRLQKASMWRDRLFPSISTLGDRLAKQAAETLKTNFVQFTMGMVSQVLNEVLYGGKAQVPQVGAGGVNYTSYTQPGRVAQPNVPAVVSQIAQFQGFEFNSNYDAQAVLRGLDDALSANGVSTVANYKELSGMGRAIDATDHRKGWTDLSRVTVKRTWGANTWYIALPNPVILYA